MTLQFSELTSGSRQVFTKTLNKDNINRSDVEMLLLGSEEEPKHWSQLLKDVAKSSSAQGFAQCDAPALEEFLLQQFPEHIYDGQLDKLGSCALLSLAL